MILKLKSSRLSNFWVTVVTKTCNKNKAKTKILNPNNLNKNRLQLEVAKTYYSFYIFSGVSIYSEFYLCLEERCYFVWNESCCLAQESDERSHQR
jgi:hypothetical protein